MRLVSRPIQRPHRGFDLTHRLVSALAEGLWLLYGRNDELHGLEADLHLRRTVGEARAEADKAEWPLVSLRTPATTRAEPPAGCPGEARPRGVARARPNHAAESTSRSPRAEGSRIVTAP